MFHGWTTSFVDSVSNNQLREMSALLLPIVLATLATYVARLATRPAAAERPALVAFDRERLGDRRYSPARLWFSSFAAQTAAAVGVETHLEDDDVLDLELIAIQETMIAASDSIEPDEDLDSLEWLTGHYRNELLAEEAESADQPGLSSCWIAVGELRSVGWAVGSRTTLQLRVVNAADLGREAFVMMNWSGGRGRMVGRRRQAIAGLLRTSDPALLGDVIERIPDHIAGVAAGPSFQESTAAQSGSVVRRLLAYANSTTIDQPLGDSFVSAAEAARETITGTWESSWWASGPTVHLGGRSESTIRCQLFTEAEPRPLPTVEVIERDISNAPA